MREDKTLNVFYNSKQNTLSLENTETTKFADNRKEYTLELKIIPIVFLLVVHALFLYCIYLGLLGYIGYKQVIFEFLFMFIGLGMGTTAGVHRLWSHRSYKAKLPLRIFLMLAQSSAMQNNIFEWVRDHRVHHKFTDTDADPHNITRGFFFSHCGWLMCKKHPEVIRKGKQIDMSDIAADPVVQFQSRYFLPLSLFFGLVLPVTLEMYFLKSSLWQALLLRNALYVYGLNGTWAVNSFAHLWGMRPYDKNIRPAENKIVSFIAFGEGWHNYHHVFPWDYRTSELSIGLYNITKLFIDIMWSVGLAYDLKTASNQMIKTRATRSGNLSFEY